jgi:hypothetical protein
MKVLIAAIGHFKDAPTGSSRIAFDEAAELARRAEDVWVLAPGAPSLPEHEMKDGIHLLRYVPAKVNPWDPSRRSGHQEAAGAVLARHLPKVDVVHGHVPLSCLAALDFYGDSVRCCYTVHSPAKMEMAIVWRNSGFLKRVAAPVGLAMINRMEAQCIGRSRMVTALSQYTIDCIGKMHGKGVARKLQLIPGWVDTSRFIPVKDRRVARAQLRWPTDIPILFTLRRLVARMGLSGTESVAQCKPSPDCGRPQIPLNDWGERPAAGQPGGAGKVSRFGQLGDVSWSDRRSSAAIGICGMRCVHSADGGVGVLWIDCVGSAVRGAARTGNPGWGYSGDNL